MLENRSFFVLIQVLNVEVFLSKVGLGFFLAKLMTVMVRVNRLKNLCDLVLKYVALVLHLSFAVIDVPKVLKPLFLGLLMNVLFLVNFVYLLDSLQDNVFSLY